MYVIIFLIDKILKLRAVDGKPTALIHFAMAFAPSFLNLFSYEYQILLVLKQIAGLSAQSQYTIFALKMLLSQEIMNFPPVLETILSTVFKPMPL